MWRKRYLKLTEEQKSRGVIFSSMLITTNVITERVLHEVYATDEDKYEQISRLKDVSFFKSMARDMGWNVIEEIRQ